MEKFLVPYKNGAPLTSVDAAGGGDAPNCTTTMSSPSPAQKLSLLYNRHKELIHRVEEIEPYLNKLGCNSNAGPMFNKLVVPAPIANKKDNNRMTLIKELKSEYIKVLKNCCYVLDKYDKWNPFISMELQEIESGHYYNLTRVNTFENAIYHLIDWFSTYYSKITLYTFSSILKALKFNRSGNYIISNLFVNPFIFIMFDQSYVKFQQAYHICEGLDINVDNNTLIEKWCIHTVQENNGSFYKNKKRTCPIMAYITRTILPK